MMDSSDAVLISSAIVAPTFDEPEIENFTTFTFSSNGVDIKGK